jgi:hypothetical protein
LRHLQRFGSTPGHIQHLTKSKFCKLLSPYFNIEKLTTVLGIWNVALCKKI